MTFTKTLRAERAKAKFSLRQLADKTGLSASYLSDLERGLRGPTHKSVRAIAYALGIDAGPLARSAGMLSVEAERWMRTRPPVLELVDLLATSRADDELVSTLMDQVRLELSKRGKR